MRRIVTTPAGDRMGVAKPDRGNCDINFGRLNDDRDIVDRKLRLNSQNCNLAAAAIGKGIKAELVFSGV